MKLIIISLVILAIAFCIWSAGFMVGAGIGYRIGYEDSQPLVDPMPVLREVNPDWYLA